MDWSRIWQKIIIYITTILFIIPIEVYANIICNDGTISPTCYDCHRGCCSRHDGCSDNSYNHSEEITTKSRLNNKSSLKNNETKHNFTEIYIVIGVLLLPSIISIFEWAIETIKVYIKKNK